MTTFFTLTLDRAREGQYRVGITSSGIADEDQALGPSTFETETLDEAMSGVEDQLIAFFRDCCERAIPRTEDDADLEPALICGPA